MQCQRCGKDFPYGGGVPRKMGTDVLLFCTKTCANEAIGSKKLEDEATKLLKQSDRAQRKERRKWQKWQKKLRA